MPTTTTTRTKTTLSNALDNLVTNDGKKKEKKIGNSKETKLNCVKNEKPKWDEKRTKNFHLKNLMATLREKIQVKINKNTSN